eukprot:591639-Pelagomonas_calceolata.AAC.4
MNGHRQLALTVWSRSWRDARLLELKGACRAAEHVLRDLSRCAWYQLLVYDISSTKKCATVIVSNLNIFFKV